MNAEQLDEKKALARRLGLEDADLLDKSPDKILAVCNGIGPSFFPEKLRMAISTLHPSLALPADIHDLGYYYGQGTDEDWLEKNRRFRRNGVRMAKSNYGWYDPRRYLVEWDARRFAALCSTEPGRLAYYSAVMERLRDEEQQEENA